MRLSADVSRAAYAPITAANGLRIPLSVKQHIRRAEPKGSSSPAMVTLPAKNEKISDKKRSRTDLPERASCLALKRCSVVIMPPVLRPYTAASVIRVYYGKIRMRKVSMGAAKSGDTGMNFDE